mmetsp:Transcript_48133/g.127447  ORF Transcript_48133/g.127447 Transcript_48133/m.127447 type:complete len:241 (-) Transcript_48133:241-963(-)
MRTEQSCEEHGRLDLWETVRCAVEPVLVVHSSCFLLLQNSVGVAHSLEHARRFGVVWIFVGVQSQTFLVEGTTDLALRRVCRHLQNIVQLGVNDLTARTPWSSGRTCRMVVASTCVFGLNFRRRFVAENSLGFLGQRVPIRLPLAVLCVPDLASRLLQHRIGCVVDPADDLARSNDRPHSRGAETSGNSCADPLDEAFAATLLPADVRECHERPHADADTSHGSLEAARSARDNISRLPR